MKQKEQKNTGKQAKNGFGGGGGGGAVESKRGLDKYSVQED